MAAAERAAARANTTLDALRQLAFGPVVYSFNNLAGCVEQRRNRATGSLVGLYNAAQAGMDPDAGAWVTLCETHSCCVNHPTLAAARSHLADPAGWCEFCRDKPVKPVLD